MEKQGGEVNTQKTLDEPKRLGTNTQPDGRALCRTAESMIEAPARRQTSCAGRLGGSVPIFRKDTLPNPLIAEYKKRNKRNTIIDSLQPVPNSNLKWRDLPSVERHAYCEKLSKLQERSFGVPRVANWRLFDGYGFEDTLREMMKLEYIYEGDGVIFVDYSWERSLSIDNEIYPEWVLEFFSTLYFDKDVDRNNLMKEKLYFGKLEVDDKQFDHKDYWTRVGKPTLTNHKEVLVKEPLMRIVHKVIVGSLVHRVASRERCQKRDLWMMSALEESRGVNLAWIIADHLYKHAPGTKENSVICVGHYVTKIACFLGYFMDEEIKKCSKPIDCEYWISKMLADELDVENTCLKKETEMPNQAEKGSSEPRQEHRGLNSSWGDWNASLSRIERGNTNNFAYPTYEPPNVPPYSYPYIPYPYPYTHYPNPGNQSNHGGSYRLGGDDYFTSAMPDFRGSSLGYAVEGSSRGTGFNDDDDMDELKVQNLRLLQLLLQQLQLPAQDKGKGIVFHDQKEQAPASTPIVSPSQLPHAKDKGKAKMVEPEKPLKKKDQIAIDEEVARNLKAQLQAELEEDERLSRQKEEEANIDLIESWDNTQAMMDDDF
ncbi:hypothetical protein Tco_0357437 [Tanacetum coccineum]